jgi:hypothetical protein
MTDHITEEYLGLNEIYPMAERQNKRLATEVKNLLSKHYKWDADIEEFEDKVPPNYSHYKIDVTVDDTCCDDTFRTLYHIDIDLPNDDEAKELADILDGKVTQGLNAGCPEYVIRYTREIKVRAKNRGEAIAIFTNMDDKDRESESQFIGIVSARKLATKKSKK